MLLEQQFPQWQTPMHKRIALSAWGGESPINAIIYVDGTPYSVHKR
jgi:hypothetical protein